MTAPLDQRTINDRAHAIAATRPARFAGPSREKRWANAGVIIALGLTNGWALWLVAHMLDPSLVPQLLP